MSRKQEFAAADFFNRETLRTTAAAVVFLLPLVVLPGIERPFSSPKLFFLGAVVGLGSVLVVCFGLLARPALPRSFVVALTLWLAALGASACLGRFVSPAAFLLPVLAAAWFLGVMLIRPRAESLAWSLAMSATVVASIALLQFIGLDPFALAGWQPQLGASLRMRVYGTLGNPNFVAAFLAAVIPLTDALNSARFRHLPFLALALMTGALFATGSRAGALALLAASLWLVALRRRRRRVRVIIAACTVVVLVGALAPARPLATTLKGRAYVWRAAAIHLPEHLLLGSGPGAFPAKYAQWETELWSHGKGSASERGFSGLQDHAHNDYLEFLVEDGVLGLGCFLAVVLSFLVFGFGHAKGADGELRAGASAGVIALLAVALVDFPFARPTELFTFWMLIAITFLAAPTETANEMLGEGAERS